MNWMRRLVWRAGGLVRWLLIGVIRGYRLTLAGLLGGQCRFHPSCSHYAEEAIQNVGAFRGLALSAWRVLRCSPFSAGGVDQPPRSAREYDGAIQPRAVWGNAR
jgi:putative membrane protein insertion efficiency factor